MRVGSVLAFALAVASAMLVGFSSQASAQGQSITLTLAGQNNSGMSGTAVITELPGGKLRVEIRASGSGPGPQPAHIHQGTCANLDPAPKFTLASLTNGVSTTELDGSLSDMTASPHAIHLHKAPDELPVYVACADITADGGAPSQPQTLPSTGAASPPSFWPSALAGVGLVLAGLGIGRRARRRNGAPESADRAAFRRGRTGGGAAHARLGGQVRRDRAGIIEKSLRRHGGLQAHRMSVRSEHSGPARPHRV